MPVSQGYKASFNKFNKSMFSLNPKFFYVSLKITRTSPNQSNSKEE